MIRAVWVHMRRAQWELENRRPMAALRHYAWILSRWPEHPLSLVEQARILLAVGDEQTAQNSIERALKATPDHPALLRFLFDRAITLVDLPLAQLILERMREVGPARLVADFRSRLAEISSDLGEIQAVLDEYPEDVTGARRATLTATLLMGQHRYRLAERYLRRARRTWPDHPVLFRSQIILLNRIGQFQTVDQLLTAELDKFPSYQIMVDRLAATSIVQRGDLDSIIAAAENSQASALNREYLPPSLLAQCYLAKLDLPGADAALEDMRAAQPNAKPGHKRVGHLGSLAEELDLHLRDPARPSGETLDHEAARAAVIRQPGSHFAALEYLASWRQKNPPPKVSAHLVDDTAPKIPRQVYQYWNTSFVPAQVMAMTASWSNLAGIQHQLFNRDDVIRFYRQNLGPRWVRAFRMTQNPAEEADFFRVCMLAKNGGIYADADDVLFGDLAPVLKPEAGLIVFRETFGAVGNNFMAARPAHPAMVTAARMARTALLRRDQDSTWSKTGPGMVTRAVVGYLARNDADNDAVMYEQPQLMALISMHNPVHYKQTDAHWDPRGARDTPFANLVRRYLAPALDSNSSPSAD